MNCRRSAVCRARSGPHGGGLPRRRVARHVRQFPRNQQGKNGAQVRCHGRQHQRLSMRLDLRRAIRAVRRRSLAGAAGLVLSLLACYGARVALAALSAARHHVGDQRRRVERHGSGPRRAGGHRGRRWYAQARPYAPLVIALADGTVLGYAHVVTFSFAELFGFALLSGAVALNLRARRPV